MQPNETRRLMKLLHLNPDDVYHVFCLALCVSYVDGTVTLREEQMLDQIGEGLGLTQDDVKALGENARAAIRETSPADVIAFSLATLKAHLNKDQLSGIKIILKYVALADHKIDSEEKQLLDVVEEVWQD
jgi:uncharacterized tellurite resistance protein B-like protein